MEQNNGELKKYIYNLEISTITPIHIGNGNLLRPDSKLLEFKENNYKIINPAFVSNDIPQEISEFIHTNGKSFFPGSSIKGAFKSAYLYYWLTKDNFGKRKLNTWIKELNSISSDGKLNNYIKKKFIEKGDNIKENKNKKYFGFDNIIIRNCFGESIANARGKYNKFFLWNNLRLLDSDIDVKQRAIYELRRFYIESEYNGIPTFLECIKPEETFETQLQYINANEKDFIFLSKNLNKIFTDKNKIKKLINEYSLALIEYEINTLNDPDIDYNTDLDNYKNFLNNLKETIEGDSNDTLYLRIGAGKMQYYQNIAIALYNLPGTYENDDAWYNYKSFLVNFENDTNDFLYPKTRALTYIEKLPIGWIKITIK